MRTPYVAFWEDNTTALQCLACEPAVSPQDCGHPFWILTLPHLSARLSLFCSSLDVWSLSSHLLLCNQTLGKLQRSLPTSRILDIQGLVEMEEGRSPHLLKHAWPLKSFRIFTSSHPHPVPSDCSFLDFFFLVICCIFYHIITSNNIIISLFFKPKNS